MGQQLDKVKDLLKSEYEYYRDSLLIKRREEKANKNKLEEQTKFIEVLEKERDKTSEFLSAYNNDQAISDRIDEEIKIKNEIFTILTDIQKEISFLEKKEEEYRIALDAFDKEPAVEMTTLKKDSLIEWDAAISEIITSTNAQNKKLEQTVEEYIYVDPNRVKIALQDYLKSSNDNLEKMKKMKKGWKL